MCVMLCKYTKRGNLKYISHLDVLRFMQRAVKRAGLPAAYSEGFNPHMKTAFGFPLSLGNESEGEYFELELREKVDEDRFKNKMNAVLPPEMQIIRCMYKAGKASIMAICKYVRYTIEADAVETDVEKLRSLFDDMTTKGITIERRKKNKKNKTVVKLINTADTIHSVKLDRGEDDMLRINVVFRTEETGSMKTDEFMKIIEARGFVLPYYKVVKEDSYDENMKPVMSD